MTRNQALAQIGVLAVFMLFSLSRAFTAQTHRYAFAGLAIGLAASVAWKVRRLRQQH